MARYVRDHRGVFAEQEGELLREKFLHADIFEADLVGEKICEAAWNRGAKVVLLPTIPYGTQTNQMQFPLTMNLNPATLSIVLGDLVESLARHGVLKIVLLNSHGGNELKPLNAGAKVLFPSWE